VCFFDIICLLILFSLLIGVIETNLTTEYNKSDFFFWVTSLYQFVHLDTCDRSSEYYWAFLLLLAPISQLLPNSNQESRSLLTGSSKILQAQAQQARKVSFPCW